jgi:hypothetical protein
MVRDWMRSLQVVEVMNSQLHSYRFFLDGEAGDVAHKGDKNQHSERISEDGIESVVGTVHVKVTRHQKKKNCTSLDFRCINNTAERCAGPLFIYTLF